MYNKIVVKRNQFLVRTLLVASVNPFIRQKFL